MRRGILSSKFDLAVVIAQLYVLWLNQYALLKSLSGDPFSHERQGVFSEVRNATIEKEAD
jgi:hypothetical protein